MLIAPPLTTPRPPRPPPPPHCAFEPPYTQGDDPETTGQSNRTIKITTGALDGFLEGHFNFNYNGHTVGFDAKANELAGEWRRV